MYSCSLGQFRDQLFHRIKKIKPFNARPIFVEWISDNVTNTLKLIIINVKERFINEKCFCFFLGASQINGENHEDDDDSRVMNNLMSDIHSGFAQRRLPDGGFKVHTILDGVYLVPSFTFITVAIVLRIYNK